MKVYLKKGKLNGTIVAPPSKSYAHRFLIGGLLSESSTITNIELSQDVLATLNCCKAFGVNPDIDGDAVSFSQDNEKGNAVFPCNESGSTLRFFIPLAMTRFQASQFICSPRLAERGVEAYQNCFKEVAEVDIHDNTIFVKGQLVPGDYVIDGSKSSQYITGMLFALPLLPKDSTLTILGELTSKPYVDITLDVLKRFGVEIVEDGKTYRIKGNQKYRSLHLQNEGDYSNAAFLDAFNYLGSDVQQTGLNPDSLQGDKVYLENFKKLNQGYATIDVENCIDLAPVMFSLASLLHGARFIHTRRLALKECDRSLAMKEELEKAGAKVDVFPDEVLITPISSPRERYEFASHNDHRIAMAMSLYASQGEVEIDGYECVKKSYPDYFERLKKLGMEVSYGTAE